MRIYQQNIERKESIFWTDYTTTQLALSGTITGTFTIGAISSLLAADAASAQPDVEVADATLFCAGQDVTVADANASEVLTILSINYGTNVITMTGNLVNAYTVADAGVVSGTASILGATSAAIAVIDYVGTDYVVLSSLSGDFADAETAQQGNGADIAPIVRNMAAIFYPTANRNRTSPALFRNIWSLGFAPLLNTSDAALVPNVAIREIATDRKVIVASVTQGTVEQQATASADLALTGVAQDITGATLTLAAPGVYEVMGVFHFQSDGDPGQYLIGTLDVAGVAQSQQARLRGIATSFDPGTGDSSYSLDTNVGASVAQVWRITTTAVNTVVKLRAYKDGGAGASIAGQTHTRISAKQISAWAPTGITVYAQMIGD